MSLEQNIAEARIVFGDDVVEQAMRSPRVVEAEVRGDISGVRFDVMTLMEFLPEHLGDAIEWAKRLSDARRVAIAGLWCGNSTALYAMAENGLFLRGGVDG